MLCRFKSWFKRWALWIAIVAVAAFFGGRGQLQGEELSATVDNVAVLTKKSVVLSEENRGLVTSLQAAVVESCVENGNAARRAARETLQEEIFDAEHPDPDIIAAFDLPPATLEKLLDENVTKLRKRLGRVKAVNCAEQYRISPGSGDTRRRDRVDSSTP